MEMILAADRNWAIGRDGGLLVHLSGDLRDFKQKTSGKVIIMGRKTVEGLPGGRPLPARTTILVSRNRAYRRDDCIVVYSIEEAVAKARALAHREADIFVCGGAEIYRQMLPLCQTCYVTKIDGEFPADSFFPNLDKDPCFRCAWEGPIQEENGIGYRFTRYERTCASEMIIGRNPVIEALKNGREVDKLCVSSKEGSMVKILAMAKERAVPVITVERAALDRMSGGRPHQGVIAFVSAYRYAEMADIFALAEKRGEDPFIVILDNIEDPHNLGAIMRTAECAGAHGIIIPRRHACGLTEVVAKASAGAIEYVPCVKVTNLVRTIKTLQEQGFWVAACDMGGQPYYRADLRGKLAVVIGSEGAGISKLTRETCDFVVSMPMVGKINSLNASNAAAVVLYEVRKQRDGN